MKDLTASRWSKHRDGSWRSRLRGPGECGTCERRCSEGSKSTCFWHFLLNHLQTRRKPTGHWWVECGKEVFFLSFFFKEVVGKTVNSERARTDPVRTYVRYGQVTAGRPRPSEPKLLRELESGASIAPVAVKSFTTLSRGSMFLFQAISRPWFAEI